ncbi:MAG: energy transducer TonB, partial [Methylococcales bacterium]|nr:energy transducer TonB [Methylococcales bacterium]
MDKKTQFLRRLPVIIGVISALVIGVGVYFLQGMFEKPAQAKKQVQQITMIQPPPPPPPPPPVQKPPEPEPEPEKIPEPEKEPEPEPQPEEAPEPQSDQLGVDADGAAGSDGFGLVGKKGGAGLLGGSGGSTILWYGGLVKRGLESGLQNALEGAARESSYSVQINIWINASGRVERAELGSSSGNAEVDSEIRAALPKLHFALEKAPPENMPQPLKIRVTSRL